VAFNLAPNEVFYGVDGEEGFWNEGVTGEYIIGKKGGYHQVTPFDTLATLRGAIVERLMSLGVPVKYHHHEVGTCQVEIELDFCDALKAADYTMLIKYVARNVAKGWVTWSVLCQNRCTTKLEMVCTCTSTLSK